MEMRELDTKVLRALNTDTCPRCGEVLNPVIVDGAPDGFDCLRCQEFYSFDNIRCP